MSFWNGARWVEPETAAAHVSSRRANWAATIVMLVGLALMVVPFAVTSAASHRSSPTLSVGCGSGCLATSSLSVGSTLMVHGTGFTPSAGGQQVILWVGYPNDYCSGSACHGFYADPWVASDGTFNVSFDNATLQAGTGEVKATQYNVRTDHWVGVALVDYTVR